MSFFENSEITVIKWLDKAQNSTPSNIYGMNLNAVFENESHLQKWKELAVFLQDEWEKIPDNIYQNLVLSMNNRVKAVLEANVYATKY